MPTFQTPEPIAVTIEMASGSVRVRAADRADTVAEVSPHNPGSDSDVQTAAQTRVEYTGGRLVVRAPRNWLRTTFASGGPRIDVLIDLPAGSEIDATGWADYTCAGRLGPVGIASAVGDVRIEHAERLRVKSSMGEIIVGRVDGAADVRTSAGAIRLGEVAGAVEAKTSTGDVTVGEVGGDLRLKTSMGAITIDRAPESVDATTSAGDIRIGEVGGGTVALRTSYGEIEIGVPADVAAWLDLNSRSGVVRSELDAAGTPAETDRKVEITARSGYGDIIVRRA